jgi:hypothetical protein
MRWRQLNKWLQHIQSCAFHVLLFFMFLLLSNVICFIIKGSFISSVRLVELRKVLMRTKELLWLGAGVMMVLGYLLVRYLHYTPLTIHTTVPRLQMLLTLTFQIYCCGWYLLLWSVWFFWPWCAFIVIQHSIFELVTSLKPTCNPWRYDAGSLQHNLGSKPHFLILPRL